MFASWIEGFTIFFNFTSLVLMMLGTLLGLVFGSIPGLTAALAVAILVPLSFGLPPAVGLTMLIGAYVGGISGGLVSATVLGMPGTPSSVATTFDAFPLAKKGFAGKALGIGITASCIGGLISGVILVTVAPLLARVALTFSSFEYTMIMFFGLTTVVSLSGRNIGAGLVSAGVGLSLATIGPDPLTGTVRNTMGLPFLEAGIRFFPALIGLFVVTEVLDSLRDLTSKYITSSEKITRIWPTFKELRHSWLNFLRSSLIGVGIGILPGIGPAVSNFVSYDQAKKASKDPDSFGKGNIDGIIASETSNNATLGGALIPMLTLGIPGDAVTAILLGGLMIHGIQPGPLLFRDQAGLVNAIFISYFFAAIFIFLFMMLGGVKLFVKLLRLPKYVLLPLVIVMCVAGIYNESYAMIDVYSVLLFGVLGLFFKKAGLPIFPIVIALILGPMFEVHLRTALMASAGSFSPFFTRPVSIGLFIVSIVMVGYSVWVSFRKTKEIIEKES